jgi:hypothetical protein
MLYETIELEQNQMKKFPELSLNQTSEFLFLSNGSNG